MEDGSVVKTLAIQTRGVKFICPEFISMLDGHSDLSIIPGGAGDHKQAG